MNKMGETRARNPVLMPAVEHSPLGLFDRITVDVYRGGPTGFILDPAGHREVEDLITNAGRVKKSCQPSDRSTGPPA